MKSSSSSRKAPGTDNPAAKLFDYCDQSLFPSALTYLSSLNTPDTLPEALNQIFYTDKNDMTALHTILYKGGPFNLTSLIIQISLTDPSRWPLCSMKNNLSYTPLYYAVAFGDNVETARLLTRTYPNALSIQSKNGQTPLAAARTMNRGRNKAAIVALLEACTDLHSRGDLQGLDELCSSSEEQKQQLAEQQQYLERQNNLTLARSTLSAAVYGSSITALSKSLAALAALDVPEDDPSLLEAKQKIDTLRESRKSLTASFNVALAAITSNDTATLADLVAKDPILLTLKDPENVQSRTLLHYASSTAKSAPCLPILLAALSRPPLLYKTPQNELCAPFLSLASPLDSSQRTPLHDAVKNALPATVKTLLSHAAATDAQDGINWTPLHWAARHGLTEIAALLLSPPTPSPIEALDSENRTPLLVAAENEHFELVKLLVDKYKANPNARNKRDESAAELGDAQTQLFVESFCLKQTFDVALTEGLRLWKEEHPIHTPLLQFLRDSAPTSPTPGTPLLRELQLFMAKTSGNNPNPPPSSTPPTPSRYSLAPPNPPAPTSHALEKIRTGTFDILRDNIFDANKRPHDMLHLALAFASQPKGVCTVQDVRDALDKYEATLSANNDVDPLYLLAHARLAMMELGKEYVAVALLLEFQPYDGAEHLRESEIRSIIDSPKLYHKKQGQRTMKHGPVSTIEGEWNAMCTATPALECEAMSELMALTGLEAVKEAAISIYTSVLADAKLAAMSNKQNRKRVLNFAFVGNPGTGKSTVARIFARVLEAAGVRSGNKFIQMTGSQALRKGARTFATELASLTGGDSSIGPRPNPLRRGLQVEVGRDEDGVTRWYPGHISFINAKDKKYGVTYTDGTEDDGLLESDIRAIGAGGNVGGVLFLDEAYDLDPANDSEGKAIMAEIMSAAEDHRDKVTIILAGYKDDIEQKLYAFNSGMASRFRNIEFEDFDESQLKGIWESLCRESGYECDSKKTSDVAARRLARGAMRKGFGNARTVRKLVDKALQSAEKTYLNGGNDAKPIISVFDVIGKPPTFENIPALKAAFDELEKVTGLQKVKDEMYNLLDTAQKNFEKEEHGFKIGSVPLNRLFLGNPGTGKTTIAKIYGNVLKALNFLEKGDVVFRSASDFLGSALGESERKTAAILELSEECVLIVDEAYSMDDQMFGKRALDTFVEKLQGEGIAVVMIGYENEMKQMFRNQNPGLSSRFDFAYALQFQDFSNSELLAIISECCRREEVAASIKVKVAAVQQLAKRRDAERNFGNARAANNLVADAIKRMYSRIKKARDRKEEAYEGLIIEDIEGEKSEFEKDPMKVLEDLQGDETEGWKRMLLDASDQIYVKKAEGKPLRGIVKNMIFVGPPGTGKTTVARKMASILYSLGMLATDNVVETSGANLTGQHVGTTKKIVEEKMQEARGGILFIDEAYGVTGSNYGQEAIDTLCGMLTLEDYMDGKTIVIMGGYKSDMNLMLEENEGLKSRFSETVEFDNWSVEKCVGLVEKCCARGGYKLGEGGREVLLEGFEELSRVDDESGEVERKGWANARDSVTMFEYVEGCRNGRVAGLMKRGEFGDDDEGVFEKGDCERAVAKFVLARPRGGDLRGLRKRSKSGGGGGMLMDGLEQRKMDMRVEVRVNERVAEKKKKKEVVEEEKGAEEALEEVDLSKIKLCCELNYNRMDLKNEAKRKEEVKKAEEELKRVKEDFVEKKKQLRRVQEGEDEQEKEKAKEEMKEVNDELMEMRKKELLRGVADCENSYCFKRFGDMWVCEGGRHEVSEKELMRAYAAAYPSS